MKVEIYTGLGSQRHRIWKGSLDILPRIGEDVVTDKAGAHGFTVERIHHWLADGPRVEIFVRS